MTDNYFTEGTEVITDVEGHKGYIGKIVDIDCLYTDLGVSLEVSVVFPEHPDQTSDTVFVFSLFELTVVGQPPHVLEERRRWAANQERS